ncbi:TetR-like C-terminal domain-containing protein [Amnibacterium sp. CER49]|uniref:TetR-like C-terminal domain-containing protein n=1 Tax=Amnibacterium sp. CER49 TaxID=3039161 RepID=UPI00244BADCA|nr:TetR-like C-terminal domain-containing protein [Amnibacterium sp. CER49]MDH2442518.1 TetR-like C-terminal domain-containing protein [Amnibacterium sp. CER49]
MARAGLSRDAVVDLAVRLIDEAPGSADRLTLAAVAAEAGVAVPSLYKHITSLADLRRAVALVALRELVRRSAAATVGRSGPDALRALGTAIRAYAREHPGLYSAAQVSPEADDPASAELAAAALDAVELVAAVLRGFALPETRLVDAVRVVRSAVHGFVLLERAHGFGMPEDVDRSFDALLTVLVDGVAALARS